MFKILAEVVPRKEDDAGATSPVSPDKGRPGMDQRAILVSGALRLGPDADFDRILELADEPETPREMLGHTVFCVGWRRSQTRRSHRYERCWRLYGLALRANACWNGVRTRNITYPLSLDAKRSRFVAGGIETERVRHFRFAETRCAQFDEAIGEAAQVAPAPHRDPGHVRREQMAAIE